MYIIYLKKKKKRQCTYTQTILTLGTLKPTRPAVALILSRGLNFSPVSRFRKYFNSLILLIIVVYWFESSWRCFTVAWSVSLRPALNYYYLFIYRIVNNTLLQYKLVWKYITHLWNDMSFPILSGRKRFDMLQEKSIVSYYLLAAHFADSLS